MDQSDAQGLRFPLDTAAAVAEQLVCQLQSCCRRIEIVGSIRRECPQVSDVELLMVPKEAELVPPGELVARANVDLADLELLKMLQAGTIQKRKGARGWTIWGRMNKFATHCASGIPLDFFIVPESNWWNALVVRTGGAETNREIARRARRKGWAWYAGGDCFERIHYLMGERTNGRPERFCVRCERDVFDFVGLPLLPPHSRI